MYAEGNVLLVTTMDVLIRRRETNQKARPNSVDSEGCFSKGERKEGKCALSHSYPCTGDSVNSMASWGRGDAAQEVQPGPV